MISIFIFLTVASLLIGTVVITLLWPSISTKAQAHDRLNKKTALGVMIGVPVLALLMYALVGQPTQGLSSPWGPASAPSQQAEASSRVTAQDIDRMVSTLAARLEKEPQNIEGWTMLGRSYLQLERYQQAVAVYERIQSVVEKDPELLVSYAEALAGANGNSLKGKPTEILMQALSLNPKHHMALWLLGSSAIELKEYSRAIQVWTRLKTQLKPGAEDYRLIENAISQAQQKIKAP